MNEIQATIRNYLGGKSEVSVFNMQCFVGMIETGEATYDDFEAVGGVVLAAAVAKAKQDVDDARSE